MHTLPDGTPAHSFRTRLKDPGTIERITCVTRLAKTPSAALPRVITANATEHRALPRIYVPYMDAPTLPSVQLVLADR